MFKFSSWVLTGLLFTLFLPVSADEIDNAFTHPTATSRPMVYWFWMGQNITREGITGDLEALKANGFGGATMCNLSDICMPWASPIPNSPLPEIVPYASPEWWKLVHHAAVESHRLGLEFGMHNCPGYESNGGTWIPPELSMQEICFSQTPVDGGVDVAINLPRPKVDPRSRDNFRIFDGNNGKVDRPIIPARETYFKDIAVLALPAEGVVRKDQVLDLSANMTADGQLKWTAPPGKWLVYRFGHTTMGTLVQPAPWKATGLECDKMNPEAVAFHINHVLGEIKKYCGDVIGKGLDYIWFDSYEAGTPTWTPRMREEFKARRGYDMTPFLATFAHRVIDDPETSNRFATDFDRTREDLYRDVDFAVSAKLIHEAGLQMRSEPYTGPWVIGEIIPLLDRASGEFWVNKGVYHPGEIKDVVAGARAAHQNVIQSEAFTSSPRECPWNETPAFLKPIGDQAFCDGINLFMLHRFTEEPFGEKYKPGIVMGQWGMHFDRTQTWWQPSAAWVTYLTRCQGLLQWGSIVLKPDDFTTTGPGAASIRAVHRSAKTGDVYFVANLDRAACSADCDFAVTGKQPELWDPVTGTERDLTDFTFANGRTTVPLSFDSAQSFFIVFRKTVAAAPAEHHGNFPESKTLSEVAGPWQVTFDPKWGGPQDAVTFENLDDWTQRSEPGIRYYSGTAVYRTTFDAPQTGGSVSLDLGVVHDLARVRINGADLGVVWTAPWHVAIPSAILNPKGNKLEIELTNCWANRQIGDEQEPPDCEWTPGSKGFGRYLTRFPDWFTKGEPRPSQGRYTFTTWTYFTKDSKLEPSGLIGPVQLISKM
jgi:hypothetical protein